MNTNAHVLPQLQRDATTKIEGLIGGAKPQGEGEAGEEKTGENDGYGAQEGSGRSSSA